jgi:cysteine-rich repeat protein
MLVGRLLALSFSAALAACAQGTKIDASGAAGGGAGGSATSAGGAGEGGTAGAQAGGSGGGATGGEAGATTGGSGGESTGGAGGEGGSGASGGAATGGAGGAGASGGAGGAPPACGDGTLDPGEECDGATGKTCLDLGFSGGDVACTVACTYDLSACTGCGDGAIQQQLGEECDFDAQGDPLVAATCASLGYPMSGANPGCKPDCKFDIRPCECGNDTIDGREECDGPDLAGHTCVSEGFPGGMLACTPDCTLDTSGCSLCGNGMINAGEQCDGANLGGQSCVTQGFGGGMLACTPACMLDTSGCSLCGNGVMNVGEACDDGNTVSGDGCSASCTLEVLTCDPDGTYTIVGAPVAYTCCFNLVNVNVSSFVFSGDGATIGSSPSNPVSMTGAATTCPAGSFDNTGTIPGGCAETYHLTGSYTNNNTWSGTYEIKFTGPDCSCFGGAGAPCVNQLYSITAQR